MSLFEEGHLSSGLYRASWNVPDVTSEKHVVLVHGLAEHIGRYGHVALRLNAAGYSVHGLDHIGHGQSPGDRIMLQRFSDYTDGVGELLDALMASKGASRVHMIGHSMGGLIAAMCALNMPQRLHSLVLSGPAIVADPAPPGWQQWVVRLLSRLAPKAGVLELDGNAVSRDPAVVAHYFADPLVHKGKIPARLAAELFDAMATVQRRAHEMSMPMLLMHGMADTLTAPAGSELLHREAGSRDKTLRQYAGCYHEIFNEPEQDAILDEVVTWLEQHS